VDEKKRAFYEGRVADGLPCPELENRPALDGLDLVAYQDFRLLETCRPMGSMGVSPISALTMHEFFDRFESGAVGEEYRALFVGLWMAMDGATVSHYAKKFKADRKRAEDGIKAKKRGR
jgi:hypothetical protein